MLSIFWIGLSYFLGCLPFGLFIGKVVCGVDPRASGSKNIGATNVARTCGTGYGILVLILDIAKGFVPVAMALTFSHNWFFLSLTALAAVTGHMYSCFLSGKGGKGVATFLGVFLALAPWPLILSVILCLIVIAASGYVSLGSLTLAAAVPIMLLLSFDTCYLAYIPVALILASMVYWKHRDNILRLAAGQEKSWRKAK